MWQMPLNATRQNKILTNISEFTVVLTTYKVLSKDMTVCCYVKYSNFSISIMGKKDI